MSVSININHLVKRYGDNTVIPDLNLSIKHGEFFTLLGSSGCGKTTLLRMIAGFNTIEGGTISFNDRILNNISPDKRNIGMVFQNYAIFPHMTTAQNIAFGLKNRKIDRKEIDKRVLEMLKMVKIEDLKDRLPSKMSGGQQQRIALARAIVIKPDVLLMDEPLSNLDAKLRIEMRSAIKEIQNRFKITTVYVTHDQEEALAISDRIAIMKHGVIQQVGTPIEIYQRPTNLFVATFIGQSNVLEGRALRKHGYKGVILHDGTWIRVDGLKDEVEDGRDALMLVRPNEFSILEEGEEKAGVDGVVIESVFLGISMQYKVKLSNEIIINVMQQDLSKRAAQPGEVVRLLINPVYYNVFDKKTEYSLVNGVNEFE